MTSVIVKRERSSPVPSDACRKMVESAAVLLAIYSMGATVYVPHLFSTYATRYGVIGAVFAIISTLFCIITETCSPAANW